MVYLDLRGHGRSTWGDAADWSFEACADDIRAFCDTVGIDRPIVFGHSMGGPIVLLYGARHPGHASGLVVHGGFARWDTPRMVEGFRRVAGDEVAELARRDYSLDDDVTEEESARVYAAFGTVPDEEREAGTPKNLELNAHGGKLLLNLDILDQLSRIESPILVCVGELDPVTPVAAAEEVVGALPRATEVPRLNGRTDRRGEDQPQIWCGTRQRTGPDAHTAHMVGKRVAVLLVAAMALLNACDTDPSAIDGDCIARIRYEGVIYRPHDGLNPAAPRGSELGTGDVVDCGEGASAPKVDDVTVFSVKGVASSIAVMAEQGQWQGIYVAEDVPRSDWPRVLRRGEG